jgi:hypothetical protein
MSKIKSLAGKVERGGQYGNPRRIYDFETKPRSAVAPGDSVKVLPTELCYNCAIRLAARQLSGW